jgi:UDP-N-acetylglucosamine acyltransferase
LEIGISFVIRPLNFVICVPRRTSLIDHAASIFFRIPPPAHSSRGFPPVNIHPLAVVSPQAQIGADVRIGPFAIVEDDVVIGEGCRIAGQTAIKNGVRLGNRNTVCEGAVIGGVPQHVRCPEKIGGVVIGEGNTLREHVTIHRAMKPEAATTIGDNCFLMAGAHVAHDCHLANNIIMANQCLLGGHVTVDERAFLSGAVCVHQFCRVGRMAMIGGHARVVRDVPPFVTIDGITGEVVGLNLVGLKRNGFDQEQINILKAAYRLIYRSGLPWREMQQRLLAEFAAGPAGPMAEFFQGGSRGFSQERRPPKSVTLKLRKELDEVETPAASLAAPALPLDAPSVPMAPSAISGEVAPRAIALLPTFELKSKAG